MELLPIRSSRKKLVEESSNLFRGAVRENADDTIGTTSVDLLEDNAPAHVARNLVDEPRSINHTARGRSQISKSTTLHQAQF